MELGFTLQAAKAKDKTPDAPAKQQPMRANGEPIRRKPSTDQRKVRRQMARNAAYDPSEDAEDYRRQEMEQQFFDTYGFEPEYDDQGNMINAEDMDHQAVLERLAGAWGESASWSNDNLYQDDPRSSMPVMDSRPHPDDSQRAIDAQDEMDPGSNPYSQTVSALDTRPLHSRIAAQYLAKES